MLKIMRCLVQNIKSTTNFHSYTRLNYASAPTVELKNLSLESTEISNNTKPTSQNNKDTASRNNMIAAAFASLQGDNNIKEIQTPETDNLISSATTVNELLSLSDGMIVSRKYALKVVSILADWSLKGKTKISDFESDPRYIKLCKVLTKTSGYKYNRSSARSADLSTVLNITADDEAAKLVATITLPQMVKVMSTLTQQKRRSMILLRALSFNITRSTDILDVKQCGDILYSMAMLNFPDENLLQRVCNDVYKGINENLQKSAVLGSVLTSLGLLKYKDNGVLEACSQWMMEHVDLCRHQDIFALFLTMAVLNYEPPNADTLFQKFTVDLNIADTVKPAVWLDLVWSLVLLNKVTPELISTVLSEQFITKINIETEQNIANKLKMINIDAAVEHLIPHYVGPRLQTSSEIRNVEILRSKEKEEMTTSIIECLKNLMSQKHLKEKLNSGMGFYIDAECYIDSKCNPILPEIFTGLPEQKKVAVLGLDYHDMCKGSVGPTGLNVFAVKLLEAKGYQVLTVPYTEYRSRDKLVDRVQYLEAKLKRIVQL